MQTPSLPPALSPRRGLAGLEQRVLARYRALELATGTAIVVGFSGGPDSLALAALLARIADRAKGRPLLVHVDHGLRSSSADEQQRAAALAAALALPFHPVRIDPDRLALHRGVGLEEAARRERYRALAAVASDHQVAPLALAHHQDDQAETVLLHLLRGAGVSGAAGMAERRRGTVPWWAGGGPGQQLTIWRPLLAEPRATVHAYAGATGLTPIIDPSNNDQAFRRNALRQEALPLLERLSPGATAALARYAALAAEDDHLLETLTDEPYARAVTAGGRLHGAPLTDVPPALRRRVARRWLATEAGLLSAPADRVDAVLRLLDHGEGGKTVEVGEGVRVVKTGAALRLERAGS